MQNLLWIGSPFFCGELQPCGWTKVALHNFEDARVFCWEELVHLAGFTPDVLVVADKSRPPFVLGVEHFPCLTVFYSVDSHIHSWQPRYAQAFDVCLFSLLDHRERFVTATLPPERVLWSPPFAKSADRPDEAQSRIWDCLFVGTVNDNTPRRAAFLQELGKRLPGLHCTRGDYRELYPRGRVILNYSEHGDLNFRVFEAMGCGACLVTPRVRHGLTQLFVDGEHLVGYAPDNVGDALYRIDFLLKNPDIIRHIRAAALEKIDAEHRARHRAQAFTDFLCDIWMQDPVSLVAARRGRAGEIRETCLKLVYLLWAHDVTQPTLKEAYLAASRGDFGLAGI
ncbi:MAG: glycosyltransferase [Desulfovibrio sp.]|jgi:glycosyltransferase involved in cell wall biosynthesis|nr:glycosyltransferase [Desulfovibrio sp.]